MPKRTKAITLTVLATVTAMASGCDGHKKKHQEACQHDPSRADCQPGYFGGSVGNGGTYHSGGGGFLPYWLMFRSQPPSQPSGYRSGPAPGYVSGGSSSPSQAPLARSYSAPASSYSSSVSEGEAATSSRGGFGGEAAGHGGGGE